MKRKISRFIFWTPRILSIMVILLFALMSLDVISPQLSIGQIVIAMLINNLPTLVFLVILIISWKIEIFGGIAFLLAGLSYIILSTPSGLPWYTILSWDIIIAGPAFLIGFLFMVNWSQKEQ